MSTPHRKKARLRGGPASTPHGRRTEYPELFPAVNPAGPPRPHPLRWSAWADDRTIETAVDPAHWPDWTDRYFIDVEPIEGDAS